jgi:adenylosuccinate synthase
LADTSDVLTDALDRNKRLVIEGTQGFGLSLLHSDTYPHCTSRDTVAAAFVAEAGLSPIDVDEVVMVTRAFPIRVAGQSGPLANEIDWQTLSSESGYDEPRIEFTSVTKQVRRVARFDAAVVKRAIAHNRPTTIVMNHLDYVDAQCARDGKPTMRVAEFLRTIEEKIGTTVDLLGFGPASLVWRNHKSAAVVA